MGGGREAVLNRYADIPLLSVHLGCTNLFSICIMHLTLCRVCKCFAGTPFITFLAHNLPRRWPQPIVPETITNVVWFQPPFISLEKNINKCWQVSTP